MTRDAFPTFAVDIAVASTAAERPNSLDGIDTSPLKSGALGWVDSGAAAGTLFRLDRDDSATTPDGTSVVQPLAGPGRWKALVGGAINGQGQILADTANVAPPAGGVQLSTIDTTIVPDGTLAYVRSVEDQYVLDKTSALPVDGITVVAPASGGGQWIRRELGNERWRQQTEWHINANTGGDENVGDAANPLASWAEYARRVGSDPFFPSTVDVFIESDLPERISLKGIAVLGEDQLFRIRGGVKNVLQSGTLQNVTPQNRAAQQPLQLNDTGIHNFLNERVRITDGAAAGAIGWLWRSSGADSADVTQTATYDDTANPLPLLASAATPSAGDGYVIEELFEVGAILLEMRREGPDFGFGFQGQIGFVADVHSPDSNQGVTVNGSGAHIGLLSSKVNVAAMTEGNSIAAHRSQFLLNQIRSEGTYDACLIQKAENDGEIAVLSEAQVAFTGDTVFARSRCTVGVVAPVLFGNCAFFDNDTGGALGGLFVNGNGSVRLFSGQLWGDNNNTYGLRFDPGGKVFVESFANLPDIQGTVAEMGITGVTPVREFAETNPFFDQATGTMLSQDGAAGRVLAPPYGANLDPAQATQNIDVTGGMIRAMAAGVMTQNVNVDLQTTEAVAGDRIRIVKQGTDAFSLSLRDAGSALLATMHAGERGFIEAQWDGGNWALVGSGANAVTTTKGYVDGLLVTRASVSTVEIGVGQCRADQDTGDIVVTATLTADITVSGANGLDAGAEANSTWYSVWVIGDSSFVNPAAALLSTSAVAPTLPAGYDLKRRVGWVFNDATGDFFEFRLLRREGRDRKYLYSEQHENNVQVLDGATATIWTDVDLSAFVPPGDNVNAIILLHHDGANLLDWAAVRPDGASVTVPPFRALQTSQGVFEVPAPNQTIEYINSDGTVGTYAWVLGWIDSI